MCEECVYNRKLYTYKNLYTYASTLETSTPTVFMIWLWASLAHYIFQFCVQVMQCGITVVYLGMFTLSVIDNQI
jgi:hypothetical protein